MSPPDDRAGRQPLHAQLGPAYDQFDAETRARHVELLERIRRPEDVEVLAQPAERRWTVTVCTSDRVGILSIVAGLFTANRIDILSGDVFTLPLEETGPAAAVTRQRRMGTRSGRPPSRPKPMRKILDIFEVRSTGDLETSFWQAFRDELAALVALLASGNLEAARERVIDRVSQAARGAPGLDMQLLPVTVEVDNDASPTLTELRIRSADTLGFLFEFTNALAMWNVSIERVEIRTVNHEVRDTFWVTDSRGQKIRDEQRIHELRVAAVLIKQFTHLLPRAPNPAQALRQFGALTGQMLARSDWTMDVESLESDDDVLRTIADLMGVSQFLWEDFLRMQHENLFPVLRDVPRLNQAKSKAQLAAELAAQLAGGHDQAEPIRRLNQFKDREMFRIDLRHITRRIDFEDFSAELSDLAEVVVAQSAELCQKPLRDRFGQPMLDDGRPCPWCACGLGKFGGRELGFASDVELIFVYESEGATDGPNTIDNSRYFEELVSSFLRTLTGRREGIFEIDLRLRPHGKAGSLASSLDGFRQYFSHQGGAEQYERMALVKLRPVAGNPMLAQQVLAARDAFVYSAKPLDRENILHLRHRQATELVAPGVISAKHSPGGLVDIEYFVQARQIEVGHRDPSVRVTNTLEAIARLAQAGHIDGDLAEQLRRTYSFLRRLIDALRVVRGHAKDLTIPARESREFAYLARRLGYESVTALENEINGRMGFARNLWNPSD